MEDSLHEWIQHSSFETHKLPISIHYTTASDEGEID